MAAEGLTPLCIDGVEFYYVTTKEEVRLAAEMLKKDRARLGGDTETCIHPDWEGKGGSPLDPHTGMISLLIVAREDCPPVIVDIFLLRGATVEETRQNCFPIIEALEEAEYTIWHNAKFDWQMLVSTLALALRNLRCTMIMSKLLGNATGSKYARSRGHGYKDICRDLLDIHIEGKKELRASVWSIAPEARTPTNEWWMQKLKYAATDTLHLFELHDIISAALGNPLPASRLNPNGAQPGEPSGLEMGRCLYDVEFPMIPVVARIEYTGAPVSEEMLDAINDDIKRQLNESASALCKHFNLETNADVWTGEEEASPNSMRILRSPERLKELIASAVKMKKLDTTEAHFLERLMDVIEQLAKSPNRESDDTDGAEAIPVNVDFTSEEERDIFSDLIELEEATLRHSNKIVKDVLLFKRMSKLAGMDLRKFINPKTKRLHFKIDQLGTATGRTSSQKPNVQQIPARLALFLDCNIATLFASSSCADHLEKLGTKDKCST